MRIIFTVTNDLNYDQRMQRICRSLAEHGHEVTLVGRVLPNSIPLEPMPFVQKRLRCWFRKGFPFYAEYNLRLLVYLLRDPCDAVCSVDLDTLLAGCLATLIRRKKRVFDAHEYFTEVPEVVDRPFVRFFWETVARVCLPFYRHAYTVGPALARIFEQRYGLKFGVVRNVPLRAHGLPSNGPPSASAAPKMLLYQGALNEGRGIEALLESMQSLDNVELVLAGEGDLSTKLRQMASALNLGQRVRFLGFVRPDDLKKWTAQAWLGLNLLENRGQSYYYSLANKFFDTVQAGIPILTMDFPEYRALNDQHEVAVLLEKLDADIIIRAVKKLLEDTTLYDKLRQNCLFAREVWCWENEQQTLLEHWRSVESA